ncbi:hypothetical protein ANDA3_3095 [plant metagenome]|uniref:Uncharacterized protein n=1 Tax=plant metagenome TaxID=1297885 RepID=A0A484Q3Q8_9ZZZZ
MNAEQIITAMGGRATVMRITGLTKGRIAQMVKDNHVPRAWLLVFHLMKPRVVPHPDQRAIAFVPDATGGEG